MYHLPHADLVDQSENCIVQTRLFLARLSIRRKYTDDVVRRARERMEESIDILREIGDERERIGNRMHLPL